MRLLKKYFDLQKEIYEYFGYVEDWVVIPLEDSTDYNWILRENENGSGVVSFSKDEFTIDMIKEGKRLYSNTIYTQRFLSKWVYCTKDFTMIVVDTHTDGNKFLQVFDNSREIPNPSVEQLDALRMWDVWEDISIKNPSDLVQQVILPTFPKQ